MTPTDEKLRIALEALLKLQDLPAGYEDDGIKPLLTLFDEYVDDVREIASRALLAVQREHYLHSPSQAVADVVGARKL